MTTRYRTDSRDQALLGQVKAAVQRMQTLHPAPCDVTITCQERRTRYAAEGAVAWTNPTTGEIVVDLPALRHAMAEGPSHFWMPAATKDNTVPYVIAHEWGHLFQSGKKPERLMLHIADEINDNDAEGVRLRRDMSEYARSSPWECLAEAHAEFYVTLGKTRNTVALTLAKGLGWTIPAARESV